MKLPRIPYWPFLLGPFLIYGLGYLMNAVVIAANGGQMPVLFPGGCPDPKLMAEDVIHVCMDASTRLSFLADWMFLIQQEKVNMYSPGDFLVIASRTWKDASILTWAVLMIKDYWRQEYGD